MGCAPAPQPDLTSQVKQTQSGEMKRGSSALAAIILTSLSTLPVLGADSPAIDRDSQEALQAWQRDYGDTHEQRMKWWREARFGMFIHWGVYSVPAGSWNGHQIGGIGEWIMNRAKIPVADYQSMAKQFNTVN